MKSFYKAPVSYFEVSFIVPNPRDSKKIKANFERSILTLIEGHGLDVKVDASYGKDFDTVHFSLEFASEADFSIIEEDLMTWLKIFNVI